MKPWKQAILIGVLGLAGGLAGLGAAFLALGPGAALDTAVGQWTVRHLLGGKASLPDGRAVVFPGDTVPTLELHDLKGQLRPIQFGDRPTLINFWASWCPPCIEEMPLLDRFARAQAGTGVRVIGIALDDPDEVRTFLSKHPVSFPIRIEPSGPNDSSMQLGNARGVLPYSVLIGADGTLEKVRMGAFRQGELESWTGIQ